MLSERNVSAQTHVTYVLFARKCSSTGIPLNSFPSNVCPSYYEKSRIDTRDECLRVVAAGLFCRT